MRILSGFKLRGVIYSDKQLLYRRYQSPLLKQEFGNCSEWPTIGDNTENWLVREKYHFTEGSLYSNIPMARLESSSCSLPIY